MDDSELAEAVSHQYGEMETRSLTGDAAREASRLEEVSVWALL